MEKKCHICQFISSKTSTFKRHMKRHEKPKLEPVGPLKCPECDKSVEIKKYLTGHRKTHEKGIDKEKNLKCTICSYQTNKRSNLNQHMNTHQPNTLPPIKSYFSITLKALRSYIVLLSQKNSIWKDVRRLCLTLKLFFSTYMSSTSFLGL